MTQSFALTPEHERDVLSFDPWGDRDATYRLIRQGFSVVRVPHKCVICFGVIAAGERVWYRIEQDDGKMATFRICAECCWCIAHRYDEPDGTGEPFGFDRMYERWEIGRQRADERPLETR